MKRGKKTREWDRVRAELKKEFQAQGITSCELRLTKQCTGGLYLSFAHSKKRRNIAGDEIKEVVLACTSCHSIIEGMGETKMREIVKAKIGERLNFGEKVIVYD